MSLHALISLLVTLAVFVVLQMRRGAPTDVLFMGGLMVVTLLGVVSPTEALAGFANPALLTVGALFVVAAGLQTTGVLDRIGQHLLGNARNTTSAMWRLSVVLAGTSAFVTNTAVVAMFVPVVLDWCRRRGISPSRLLIPVSYLAIMGGTCTLIGTSTNLIVNSLLKDQYQKEQFLVTQGDGHYESLPGFHEQLRQMSMFEIGKVGLPCTIVGACCLLLLRRRLLPNRTELLEQFDERRREYLVEMLVQPECRLVGKTVGEAGLRQLRGLFLIEISREDELITPVTPSDMIHAGDRLVFTGVVTTIVDLEKIPGLVPAADLSYEVHPHQRQQRHLTEVVLSSSSPLMGRTVRSANFRERYNAAVVAVHRNGTRLPRKIGDIELEPGDTLLLQTRHEFAPRYRHSRDFYLVADVEGSQPRRHHRAWLAAGLMLLLIVWLSLTSWLPDTSPLAGFASPAIAALAIAGLMVVSHCVAAAEARSVIDLQVLLTIAAALGLGQALTVSGAAEHIAGWLAGGTGAMVSSDSAAYPYVLLAVLYLLTVLFTETISNNAVAVMLFPIGVAMAAASGLNPRPFVMAIALAASMSFLTPIGYQTNLMVMGPGGYRPRDYLRAGWPVALLVGITAWILIPVFWPFEL